MQLFFHEGFKPLARRSGIIADGVDHGGSQPGMNLSNETPTLPRLTEFGTVGTEMFCGCVEDSLQGSVDELRVGMVNDEPILGPTPVRNDEGGNDCHSQGHRRNAEKGL